MMKKLSLIGVLAAICLPSAVLAEHHEESEQARPLTEIWMVVPKQGMQAEFTEAAMKHMAFRANADDSQRWPTVRPVNGDNLKVVQFRACCFDYADQDAWLPEDEKLGFAEAAGAMFNKFGAAPGRGACLQGQRQLVARYRERNR